MINVYPYLYDNSCKTVSVEKFTHFVNYLTMWMMSPEIELFHMLM